MKRHLYEEYKNAKGSIHLEYLARFTKAINDDLDTPKAVALMWELVKDDSVSAGDKVTTIKKFDDVLAVGLSDKAEDVVRELGVIDMDEVPEVVQELINQREAARAIRNWEEADRLREAINLKGFTLEDTPDGPKISKV